MFSKCRYRSGCCCFNMIIGSVCRSRDLAAPSSRSSISSSTTWKKSQSYCVLHCFSCIKDPILLKINGAEGRGVGKWLELRASPVVIFCFWPSPLLTGIPLIVQLWGQNLRFWYRLGCWTSDSNILVLKRYCVVGDPVPVKWTSPITWSLRNMNFQFRMLQLWHLLGVEKRLNHSPF